MEEIISYTYSIPYLIFFGYLVLLMFWEFYCSNKNQSTKIVRYAVIMGFLFFFGLRGHLYTDFISYYPYFENLPTIWDGFKFDNYIFDIGFEWYSMIIKSIWDNYFFWVFVNTLIDVLILNIIFKRYSKYYVLSFILFFLFQGVIIEFNLYRNAKSIMFFLLSLKYLEERKLSKYMILNLIGMSFHISSILFFPLYFILHRQFNMWLLIGIFILGNLIFLLNIQYIKPIVEFIGNLLGGSIQQKTNEYLSNAWFSRSNPITIGYIERFSITILILFNYKKMILSQKTNLLFINAYFLFFISFFYFAEMNVLADRISIIFIFGYWIIIPNLYYVVIEGKMMKYIFLFFLLGYGVMKTMRADNNLATKYQNLLFGIEEFENRKNEVIASEENVVRQIQAER